MHLARKMTNTGKLDTALKIYEHALALDPTHPDLLNEYGKTKLVCLYITTVCYIHVLL